MYSSAGGSGGGGVDSVFDSRSVSLERDDDDDAMLQTFLKTTNPLQKLNSVGRTFAYPNTTKLKTEML